MLFTTPGDDEKEEVTFKVEKVGDDFIIFQCINSPGLVTVPVGGTVLGVVGGGVVTSQSQSVRTKKRKKSH